MKQSDCSDLMCIVEMLAAALLMCPTTSGDGLTNGQVLLPLWAVFATRGNLCTMIMQVQRNQCVDSDC